MPASQAGRRGFDPRLPLHVFSRLEVFEIVRITAITALSSPDHLAEPVGGCCEHPPAKPQSLTLPLFQKASFRELPVPLLNDGSF
jgi:hypothetical protein